MITQSSQETENILANLSTTIIASAMPINTHNIDDSKRFALKREDYTPSIILIWAAGYAPKPLPCNDVQLSSRAPISLTLVRILTTLKKQGYCEFITTRCGSYYITPLDKIYKEQKYDVSLLPAAHRIVRWINHNPNLVWITNAIYLILNFDLKTAYQQRHKYYSGQTPIVSIQEFSTIIKTIEPIIGKTIII